MKAGLLTVLAAGLAAAGAAGAADTAAPTAEARAMLSEMRELFGAAGPMAPGMPGNRALEAEFARRFAQSGFTNGFLRFRAPLLVPGETVLLRTNQAPVRLSILHPTLYRIGNFAQSAFSADLVYLGKGAPEDLARARGANLAGAIALMDFDCGDDWRSLLRFGLQGFIFIGQSDYDYPDSYGKIYNTEVSVPRFFVDREAGGALKAACAEAAAAGGAIPVEVRSEPTRWQSGELKDLWVLIPGSDPELAGEVVLFTARLDANSVVPERATGAQAAINPYLMLKLLDDFKARPPKRSVLLAGVNGHTQAYLGERVLAWHLLADSRDVARLRGEIAREMRTARLYSENYGQLQLAPVTLDEGLLFAGVELLWHLDAQQQARRSRASAAGAATAGGPVSEIDTNAVLSLAEFTEEDYRQAARSAADAMQGTARGSLFSRSLRDSKVRSELAREKAWVERLREMDPADLAGLAAQAKPVFDDEKLLETWRVELDETSGQRLSIKKELQSAAMKAKNAILQDRLQLFRDKTLRDDERERRLAELERQRVDVTRVLVMFNRIDFGVGRRRVRYRSIAPNEPQRLLLKGYRDALTEKFSFWQRMHRERLEADASADAIRSELKGRRVVLAVSLEMTGNSDSLGFTSASPGFQGTWNVNFGKFLMAASAGLASNRTDRYTPLLDSLNPGGGDKQVSLLHTGDSAVPFFIAARGGDQGVGTPALALKNALASEGAAFSPDDSFERLDAQRLYNHQQWLREFLPRLLDDRDLTARSTLDVTQLGHGAAFDPTRGLWSILVGTFAMEELTASIVPEKAVPDSTVVLYSKTGVGRMLFDGDVVNAYAGMTDATGMTVLYGLAEAGGMAPLAYQMDPDHRGVLHALDKGRIQTTLQMNSNIARDTAKTLPLFPCREFPLLDRVDPTLVGTDPISVETIWPKNGSSKSDPARFGVHGIGLPSAVWSHPAVGPAAVYLLRRGRENAPEPETLMLVTDRKRAALNATPEQPEGAGFASAAEMGADFFGRAARDMDTLNRFRRERLKGVENALMSQFLDDGRKGLEEMEAARAARDHGAYLLAAYRALGSEVKAYIQLSSMNADMLKAILLYMALMLPFCFFIQKLLFDLDKLQHELLAFSACFVLMYVLFRLIHPAFAVAETPEAIFIAFVLGAVGAFVTMVMHSRFKGEMRLIFGKTGGIGDDAAYSTVGGTAMVVGIHNMRRRRVRTLLTTATVVLVIFTMLTFSSVSQRLDPTLIRKAADAPYTGLFYHWPGGRNMDEDTVTVLRNIFAGRAEVVVRRTLTTTGLWPLELVSGARGGSATNRIHGLMSVVGLPHHDRVFTMSMPLLSGRFFTASDAREIILPAKAAEALNLGAADLGKARLRLRGCELTLVGIADDQRLRLVRDLNPNLPFIPFQLNQTVGAPQKDAASLEIETEDVSAIVVDTSSLAILPEAVAAKVGALPHSVSIRFPDDTVGSPGFQLWQETDRLLTITHARFYVGSEEPFKANAKAELATRSGVYFVNSNYRTSIGGLARLLIPLLIAGSIILNTMLGTVYERKNEIAIYNAIGLNPTHIFMFFLAEAFVYSFIGSVGGYLIGQSLAMALQHFHLIRDIGVNFSSLMVVYAILFTIGLVLLSTLYPAYVATRTAVPSGKRRWSMPALRDHAMHVDFPFIYEGALAAGAMYYIYEDFAACTEKSLSSLIATFEGKSVTADAGGRPIYALTYSVGLSPFDLGVTQRVRLVTRYEERVKSYRLSMSIEHLSGLDSNWVALNRFFLERMRKFLMVWRNMDPALYAGYSERGEKLFGEERTERST